MLWLRKSKKGFTLIELMVVVAIIGVLSLLGLRLYTGQQEKAKNAIVKANAGTVQTLIQAELADSTPSTAASMLTAIGMTTGGVLAGMQNPYGGSTANVVMDGGTSDGQAMVDASNPGQVVVVYDSTSGDEEYLIQGYGKTESTKAGQQLTARK